MGKLLLWSTFFEQKQYRFIVCKWIWSNILMSLLRIRVLFKMNKHWDMSWLLELQINIAKYENKQFNWIHHTPGVQNSQDPHQQSDETLPVKVVSLHVVGGGGGSGSVLWYEYGLNVGIACLICNGIINSQFLKTHLK